MWGERFWGFTPTHGKLGGFKKNPFCPKFGGYFPQAKFLNFPFNFPPILKFHGSFWAHQAFFFPGEPLFLGDHHTPLERRNFPVFFPPLGGGLTPNWGGNTGNDFGATTNEPWENFLQGVGGGSGREGEEDNSPHLLLGGGPPGGDLFG